MDSMIERWRKQVKSSEKKAPLQPAEQSHHEEAEHSLRQSKLSSKSKQKKQKKATKERNEKSEGERIETIADRVKHETPSKAKSLKAIVIDDFVEKVEAVISKSSEHRRPKLRALLEELWQVSQDNPPRVELEPARQPPSNRDTPSKIQTKLYSDLESRYFECEKERHHLKSSLDSLRKRYQNVDKQLERMYRIEKLVDATVARQQQLNRQIQNLHGQLEVARERQHEQQRVFRKEVLAIHSLIETIKTALPSTT